jgi:branched-chain amino acid transport system ATP-binding protein
MSDQTSTAAPTAPAGKPDSTPGSVKADPILVVDGIRRSFGGLVAVDVDHLEIQRNKITALIGPNGAGKTTFFNLITGFDTPDSGTWTYNGEDMGSLAAHQVALNGMVRTFQLTKALSRLTVIENMKLGAQRQRGENLFKSFNHRAWKAEEAEIEAKADTLLKRFKMDHMREEFAGTLSGGQRKLLEMARALMTNPQLIMLDEPMAGVNPALTQSLLGHVKQLREEGHTVVFVEHDMDVVRDISDWVVVMAEGRIIAEGTHEEIGANTAVIDAYLGRHHDAELTIDEENPFASDDDAQSDAAREEPAEAVEDAADAAQQAAEKAATDDEGQA